MKAIYDYPFEGESITHWGVVFYPGQPSDIPAEIQDKVSRHPHFKVLADAACIGAQADAEEEYTSERDELSAEYEEKFGRKPHHKMKPETIREAIDNADQS